VPTAVSAAACHSCACSKIVLWVVPVKLMRSLGELAECAVLQAVCELKKLKLAEMLQKYNVGRSCRNVTNIQCGKELDTHALMSSCVDVLELCKAVSVCAYFSSKSVLMHQSENSMFFGVSGYCVIRLSLPACELHGMLLGV
jgi:hypothetical protein